MNRERIKLRFWQGAGPVLTGIAGVFDRWWDKVRGWIDFCLAPADARTAPMPLVNLLAWERGITRLFGEPENLYRLRVYYAFLNAKDAGQKAGFERIFQRLKIELNGQAERVDDDNWDVIFLESNDDLFTSVPGLFGALTESYGRTCRRYALIQSVVFVCGMTAGQAGCSIEFLEAEQEHHDPGCGCFIGAGLTEGCIEMLEAVQPFDNDFSALGTAGTGQTGCSVEFLNA